MNQTNPDIPYDINNPGYLVAGLLLGALFGALVGALVMLLLAPQSGKKMRNQIRRKARNLREQYAKTIESGANQVRDKAHQVTTGIQDRAEDLQQRGQEVVDEQRERWSPVVEAGKTAVSG
ncbi:YtxH domain-containing protein [Promineifilum sp.]|uniref:YtxH domain-containing protein n=1 Tax=Promineifilum sp. TaxID=2664178 RepID=UPI0035ADA926